MKTLILIITLANGAVDREPVAARDCWEAVAAHAVLAMDGYELRSETGELVVGVTCGAPLNFLESIRSSDGDCEVVG